MKNTLSKIDLRILVELQRDANRSRKLIARAVGISEPTLSKRIAYLVEEGIISGFTIGIEYSSLGYSTSAITLLKIKESNMQRADAIIRACTKIDECIEVYTTFGEWDLCVRWLCRDNASLMNALALILNEQNIAHAETITLGKTEKKKQGVPLGVLLDQEAAEN